MAQDNAIETFFSDFANSEVAYDGTENVLLEVFKGVWQGFYVEVLDIDETDHFLLCISAHETQDWNCNGELPENLPSTGRSYYRFETLPGALEALGRFQMASIAG